MDDEIQIFDPIFQNIKVIVNIVAIHWCDGTPDGLNLMNARGLIIKI